MADQAASVFVTVESVIPRLSPSGAGWEVVFIQRKKEPYIGLWALPGGHLTTEGHLVKLGCRAGSTSGNGPGHPSAAVPAGPHLRGF
jgi:ADP-ribose pyrophosphatase YjhB (NUDIX family)